MVEWTRKKVIGSIITIVFTAIFAPIVVHEYVNQPKIYYRLNAVDTVDFKYQTLSVELRYSDKGGIDTTIVLILTTENATIEKPEPLPPYIIFNETQTEIRIATLKDMDYYASKTLNILPKNNPQTFSMTLTVDKPFDVGSMFWTPKPIYPITLTYNKTDTSRYIKITG